MDRLDPAKLEEERKLLLTTLDYLEEKVGQAADSLESLREERDAARAETEKLRSALRERGDTVRQLETQLLELQGERADIRRRVEHLVDLIESVEEEAVL